MATNGKIRAAQAEVVANGKFGRPELLIHVDKRHEHVDRKREAARPSRPPQDGLAIVLVPHLELRAREAVNDADVEDLRVGGVGGMEAVEGGQMRIAPLSSLAPLPLHRLPPRLPPPHQHRTQHPRHKDGHPHARYR
eukprot:363047-Chlamydomonas_euryale.AAC.11